MLKRFKEHIKNNFPELSHKKLVIAISGGVDSVVLAYLLAELSYTISLAHCNFQLRGEESDRDEEFVKSLANDLQLSVYTKSFNTKEFAKKVKLSIQLAARKLRYDWFRELLSEHNFDFVLTAHHADDNLETFLINTIRGTGLEGLTGIPESNNIVLRPLLPFSREEILDYALKNNIKWQEDSSNLETKYLRNKIRHHIVPVLKELNPNFFKSFNLTLENLKGSSEIIKDKIRETKNLVFDHDRKTNNISIHIEKVKQLTNPKTYLFELLRSYGFTAWNDIQDLLDAQPGKQVLSETHRIIKDRDCLLLSPLPVATNYKEGFINEIDISFKNDDMVLKLDQLKAREGLPFKTSKNSIIIDKDLLKFPLVVRKWKEGDYFYPFGMQGKKKLSKFFKDEKLSIIEKEKIWLLCSGKKIVWIIGHRLDDRFKVNENTNRILKIKNLV